MFLYSFHWGGNRGPVRLGSDGISRIPASGVPLELCAGSAVIVLY